MGERVYEKTRYVKDPKDINEAKELVFPVQICQICPPPPFWYEAHPHGFL